MSRVLLATLPGLLALYACASRIKSRSQTTFEEDDLEDQVQASLVASAPLVTQSGEAAPANALESKVVAIYFSAHWCGPCRQFTPVLRQFYEVLKANGANIEIVFVSSDSSEEEFQDYFQNNHGDWLAVQFGSSAHDALIEHYQVRGIPTLVVVDGSGTSVVSNPIRDVAAARSVDKVMKTYSKWKGKVLSGGDSVEGSPLASASLVTRSGLAAPANALEGKVVAIYFSAHWCGPCRMFTPMLRKFYTTLKSKGKELEIVFVSLDNSEASFESYFLNEHGDWLAVEYESDMREELASMYGVRGIPTLVVVDSSGRIVVEDAAGDVQATRTSGVKGALSAFAKWEALTV